MTSAIQHGGVMRAALSLEYAEPGEPDVVQFLTSGGRPPCPHFIFSLASISPLCNHSRKSPFVEGTALNSPSQKFSFHRRSPNQQSATTTLYPVRTSRCQR